MNSTTSLIPNCTYDEPVDATCPNLAVPSPVCKVAYLMSRFPKLTETFVLFEMLAVERQGAQVEVFPLLGGFSSGKEVAGAGLLRKWKDHRAAPSKPTVMHAEAAPLVARARYLPFLSIAILLSNMATLVRRPVRYVQTLLEVIRDNWGNANFLWGGLVAFPKCVHFARQMEREQIDHVHAHFANHPATAAYVIHRLTGIPYSFTAHGSDLHRHKQMLTRKVAHAHNVIAISAHNREVIVEHCHGRYAEKVQTIHCGVDLETFRPSGTSELPHDDLQVICVGTLHEVKGQAYLIQALGKLQQRGISFHLHLVGEGPDLAMLHELVRRESLERNVSFHGAKTRNELVTMLQQADVLAAPSVPTRDGRREGIPVVLMEGMACGLPVVASRISGIPELVNSADVGLLVPPRDVGALTEAFAQLANDRDLRDTMGRQARQRVADDFALNRNAARLVDQFQRSSATAQVTPLSAENDRP